MYEGKVGQEAERKEQIRRLGEGLLQDLGSRIFC